MISTDMTSAGVRTVTSPAAGLRCSAPADVVVRMAPCAAPSNLPALPVAGTLAALRLRGLLAAAGTTGSIATGARFGTDAQLFVQNTDPKGFAVTGDDLEHISSTPGDLPPEDPLS